jgi:2-polyprenyl-6-methoxyphenol hydroxylase-like FAD-dependent oxidoreductase
MRKKSVLISGIGIAGPTLAYWLEQGGFAPVLVERAPQLRSGGYVIDFWGRGYDVAERMGLVPALRRDGYEVDEVRFVDARGRRVGGFGAGVFGALTGGRYVSLPRGDLATLVYRGIDGRCETIFGDSIAGIEPEGEGLGVAFERGRPRRFDLAIGADGLHSAVRNLVFGSQDRFERYLGYVVAAFEVEGYRPRDEGVYVSYAAPGRQVARFAMRDDKTVFLFVFAADRPPPIAAHDLPAQKALLRAEFGGLGWECPQILAALNACGELYFDRVSQIRMASWTRGRVALVGDAAFCPSLLAGQGAALGMIAAYLLAAELAEATAEPEAAFRRYEARLRPFIAAKQRAAEGFARSFAPRTWFGLFLRNQITRTFALPLVARLAIGRGLLDRIELPDFPGRR